jgi:two-component system, NarL family, sensor histidine kinase DevS
MRVAWSFAFMGSSSIVLARPRHHPSAVRDRRAESKVLDLVVVTSVVSMAVEQGPDGRFTLKVDVPSALRQKFDDLGAWGLLDLAPVATTIVDRSGTILFANRALLELFRLDAHALEGSPIETLLPADVRDAHRGHRARYAAEPRVRPMGVGLELRAVRSDGSTFPVEVSLSPVSNADGELVVVAGITDISPRQEAARETAHVRRLLDAASEGIVVFDLGAMHATYVNAGAAAITGYERDELLSMRPEDLDARLDRATLERFVCGLDGSGGQQLVSTTLRRRDGEDVDIELHVSRPTLHDDTGERGDEPARTSASSLVLLLRDVTEQRRGDASLALMREQLAVAEDRDRIARDLHDTVIQQLFGIGLKLQGAAQRAGGPTAEQVEQAVDAIDDAIRELRTAVFGLGHRHRIDRGPEQLADQLAQVIDESTRVLGFRPTLRAATLPLPELPAPVTAELIPTLREALANVARHAQASSADVVLHADGTELILEVTDDGVGVELPIVRPGNGIANLRARAARLGGSFDLRAGPERGTVVRWRVPLGPPG